MSDFLQDCTNDDYDFLNDDFRRSATSVAQ